MTPPSPSGDSPVRYSFYDYLRGFVFFSLYGIVKYLPSPVGDVARYLCLKPFMRRLKTIRIKDGATFWFPHDISIGANVSINEWVFIDGYGGVEIGDYCRIAHGCSLVSEDHRFSDLSVPIAEQGKVGRPIRLGRDVWLGAGVRVVKGVDIGDGCVVGAGAVVTHDLPPYSIAAGVPAKVIRSRADAGEPR
jgi:acetyltransferase-like isoleucine patch superfamily enzyme